MKPVKQTKDHTKEQKGNSMAAAIASLLDRPLSSVPEFEAMGDNWACRFMAWLDDERLTYSNHKRPPEGFAIANGLSCRGTRHSVIVENGNFKHDPHPSNDFVEAVFNYWTIQPVKCRISRLLKVQ